MATVLCHSPTQGPPVASVTFRMMFIHLILTCMVLLLTLWPHPLPAFLCSQHASTTSPFNGSFPQSLCSGFPPCVQFCFSTVVRGSLLTASLSSVPTWWSLRELSWPFFSWQHGFPSWACPCIAPFDLLWSSPLCWPEFCICLLIDCLPDWRIN